MICLVCKTLRHSKLCTISKDNLICVVVNKLGNIISLKSDKGITVAKTMGQEQLTIHTNQVSTSYNGVNMNNGPSLSAVVLHFNMVDPVTKLELIVCIVYASQICQNGHLGHSR